MARSAAPRRSAGLMVYRRAGAPGLEVFLGHMGGPYWARKQERAWSVPKGEYVGAEAAIDAARREFREETTLPVPEGELLDLGEVRQSGGKLVMVWAVEGDLDPAAAVSNSFTIQWPPRSGRTQEFPELDQFAWVEAEAARELLVAGQVVFLDRLLDALDARR